MSFKKKLVRSGFENAKVVIGANVVLPLEAVVAAYPFRRQAVVLPVAFPVDDFCMLYGELANLFWYFEYKMLHSAVPKFGTVNACVTLFDSSGVVAPKPAMNSNEFLVSVKVHRRKDGPIAKSMAVPKLDSFSEVI